MNDIRKIFLNTTEPDSFQRIGTDHPLPIFAGKDENAHYSLFCVTPTAPKKVKSSEIISLFIGQRKDGNVGITFSLKEQGFLEPFIHFCDDIIETSRNIKETAKAADFLAARYELWQKAFARTNNGLLEQQEIKGLLGELCFLKDYMIPRYGEDRAIESWIGPDMADQDFVCDGTWYEVKTTVSGASTVSISSVEQLDTEVTGHLAVVRLDKTSSTDLRKITINQMVESIAENLVSDQLKSQLKTTLLRLGYYADPLYDAYCFHFNGMEQYRVDASFPCARKKNIPLAVQNMKYELSLAAVSQYKEE